ncbi:MAG: hypothetical protein HOQ02_01835, partial [Lysobacter sp.]|nr:hypothetical protein [Lysobacter sp.]
MPAASRTLCFALVAALAFTPLLAAEKASPTSPDDPTSASLEALLAGEFALQSGRLDDAAQAYLDAARQADDVALAERATRIALLAKDDKRAAQALDLWRKQGGEGLNLAAAEAVLAIRRGNEREARKHLTELLQTPGDAGWRQALGVLSGGARDPKQAARLLDKLVDSGRIPNKLQAWLAFGGLAQALEQPELVERIVAEVVERFPGEARVGLLRASQLRENGKTDEARKLLESLAAQAGDDAELRRAIADEY